MRTRLRAARSAINKSVRWRRSRSRRPAPSGRGRTTGWVHRHNVRRPRWLPIDTASWRGRCATTRVVVLERPTHGPHTGGDRRSGLVVADLSFISLATVLPALLGCAFARRRYRSSTGSFEVGKSSAPVVVQVTRKVACAMVLAVARRAQELGCQSASGRQPAAGVHWVQCRVLPVVAHADRPGIVGQGIEDAAPKIARAPLIVFCWSSTGRRGHRDRTA